VFSSIFLIVNEFVPAVHEKVDYVSSMFSSRSNIEGSSTEMRTTQLFSVMYYIKDSPYLGRGKDFFSIDLGWKDVLNGSSVVDPDLCGMEGVYLQYLLERGSVGYMLYLVYWFVLFFFFFRNRRVDRELGALALSIWTTYFVFSHSTGNLLSLHCTLLLLGVCLKLMYVEKKKLMA
jgi:O-antigen ligase